MSQATIAFAETDLTREIVKQMRAIDTYGQNDALAGRTDHRTVHCHQGTET